MKPCGKYRKQIALLGMDSSEVEDQRCLRDHLEACGDCQRYFAEMRGLAEKLRAATPKADAETPFSFHRGIMEAIANADRRPLVETGLRAAWFRYGWRVTLPIGALVALALAVWLNGPRQVPIPKSAPLIISTVATTETGRDMAPTISNYEMVAHQSLDKLDSLLTAQGTRNSLSFPLVTAGQLSLVNSAD
jgi:hypothetical protein